MSKEREVVVEVLPPGNCRGSLDWWLEDLANFWWKLYIVGEGEKKDETNTKARTSY